MKFDASFIEPCSGVECFVGGSIVMTSGEEQDAEIGWKLLVRTTEILFFRERFSTSVIQGHQAIVECFLLVVPRPVFCDWSSLVI